MTAIVNSPVTRQTDIIGQLRKDVDALKAAQRTPQLNYSALHNTAIPMYGLDDVGITELRGRIGKQPDGHYAIQYVNGVAPPIPSGIGIAERQLGILFTWDGSFSGNESKPSNFGRLDIYIGDESGFTTSVDTLMGSMFTESALFIGSDVTAKYIRIVAVNTSDVASSMTAEVAVTPLPAGELAAGSVNAIHLAAEIVLATTIIIGDVDGGRLVFSPEDGLELYMPDGTTRSVHMDHTTGNLIAVGTYKTAEEGARTEWNPGGNNPHVARFFPSDGSNYGELQVAETSFMGTPYAIMWFNAAPTEVTGETSFVYSSPGTAGLTWQKLSEYEYSHIEATKFYATVRGVATSIIADHRYAADASGHRIVLSHRQADGNVYPNSILEWKLNAGNVGYLRNPAKDSAIVFESLGIHARDAAEASHIPMYASAFTISSSVETKNNIEPIPYDTNVIIQNAPSRMWERRGSKEKHFGPVAEDLPPEVQRDMMGTMGVDLGSLVGILWDQVSKLTKRVDELENKKPAER